MQLKGYQYFDEYILIAPGSDYGNAMWSDINKLDNGIVLGKVIESESKILDFIHHIHFSFTLNKIMQLPFQNIWHRLYSLSNLKLDSEKSYCIIYTDISACRTDVKYIKRLRCMKNVTTVLILVNTMIKKEIILRKRLPFFDFVFSFDKLDCKRYGFLYYPTNYSVVPLKSSGFKDNDVFYVGVSKGRQDLLEKIFLKFTKNNIKCLFYISGTSKKNILGIHYNKWLSYKEVLMRIDKSNCILEVMEGQQQGVTLRAMEAICYNKLLITNNTSIKASPFYKTGNILVFNNIEDIDINFIKLHNSVDYNYNNEFSPIHLLESINRFMQLKMEG